MSEKPEVVDKVILLPRYSSFAGAASLYTGAMNVRPYGRAIFAFTQAAALGSPAAAAEVIVQGSPDLDIWNDIDGALTSGGADTREFAYEWIRLKITISGTVPGVTCWCVADFVRRES